MKLLWQRKAFRTTDKTLQQGSGWLFGTKSSTASPEKRTRPSNEARVYTEYGELVVFHIDKHADSGEF